MDMAGSTEMPVGRGVYRALYIYGLDGDDPDEFPELARVFFKGRKDPVAHGWKVFNAWLREGS
jgi:hypothetical protein